MEAPGGISTEPGAVRVLLLYTELDSGSELLVRFPSDRFDVVSCRPSQHVTSWIEDVQPDIVLLAGDGQPLEVLNTCELVRGWTDRPVVALSQIAGELFVARALATGIDEYLTLPIGDQELLARIEALLRRTSRLDGSGAQRHIGSLTLLPHEQAFSYRGTQTFLSPIQYRLLACLAAAPGKVLTHQTLMSRVWGAEYVDSRHYLRLYVRYLREKLEDDPANPKMILSEWGIGYRFEPPA